MTASYVYDAVRTPFGIGRTLRRPDECAGDQEGLK